MVSCYVTVIRATAVGVVLCMKRQNEPESMELFVCLSPKLPPNEYSVLLSTHYTFDYDNTLSLPLLLCIDKHPLVVFFEWRLKEGLIILRNTHVKWPVIYKLHLSQSSYRMRWGTRKLLTKKGTSYYIACCR